ncbi:MAG: DUF2442 domain-containing protein [Clostridia bacterium]|nr:DUF2442 domain-containing protein [Clostridia bacterium]
MYIVDGIAYAGEQTPEIKVKSVRALSDYKLWVRFSDNSQKIFDFKNLLEFPCYQPLKDNDLFNSVYVDFGIVVWNNGEIDVSPEKLYAEGVPVEDELTA